MAIKEADTNMYRNKKEKKNTTSCSDENSNRRCDVLLMYIPPLPRSLNRSCLAKARDPPIIDAGATHRRRLTRKRPPFFTGRSFSWADYRDRYFRMADS